MAMFVDQVEVHVVAGHGGNGIVSFRHEKYVAYGGPFGGDGGKGGDVIFQAEPGMTTLMDLRYHRKIKAAPGENGKTKKMHGANGKDRIVKVPLGTLVKRKDNGQIIADLTEVNQMQVIAYGGRGGRGNYHFRSSRNTAPKYAENGRPGDEFDVVVELRVLADVGLVGFPSVGKSTILDAVSRAHPEIGEYPFTTLVPNVGVVRTDDGRSFILADLPGLIEGASKGKGLGHEFLKHIERCRVIVHVLDMSEEEGRDPLADYEIINDELGSYQMRLLERPQIVVANKMDMPESEKNAKRFKERYPDITLFKTTAIIHEGLEPVLKKAADLLLTTPDFPLMDESGQELGVVYRFKEKEKDIQIVKLESGLFEVSGPKIDRAFDIKKLNTEEDYYLFANQMRYMGIDSALRKAGCRDGDTVRLKGFEFEFIEN